MTSLMQLLMDFTCTSRLPHYLDHLAYEQVGIQENKSLSALLDGLSEERAASLKRYQDALEDRRSLELEARFLAAFSIARELR